MRLTILFLLIAFSSVSQTDEKGKKHGHIKQYIDSVLCPADSVQASFYGFEYYHHGKSLFEFRCSKQQRSLNVEYKNVTFEETPAPIDGTVFFYDESKTLVEEHIYNDGFPSYIKSYNYSVDKSYFWTETYYFDSLYENTPGTYFYESQNNKGDIVSQGWFRDGPKGWQVYELDEFQDVYLVDADSSFSVFRASQGDYKYPYFGANIPPYIGVVLGYEGIIYPNVEAGLAVNIADAYVPRKTGGMIGASLLFRYNLPVYPDSVPLNYPDTSYWGIKFEIGNYSLFSYGLGYRFNTDGTNSTHAVAPFVGTSFYNVQLLLSYSFFSRDRNKIGRLVNGRVEVRYVIPIPRKKFMKKNS